MLNTEKRNERSTHIDQMTSAEMVALMQDEYEFATRAVREANADIARAIDEVSERMKRGGRLFYVGCGTSGRLGVLDASECPPTYGVSPDRVIGIIAGGDTALRRAVEGYEDSMESGFEDLAANELTANDSVVGISAAGGASYVLGAFRAAEAAGALKIALTCAHDSAIDARADISIVTDTGTEVVTGSTRMKAGSAHKTVLNMLSTGVMIRQGYVYENLMIHLKPTNLKLRRRMIRIATEMTGCDETEAVAKLDACGWDLTCLQTVKPQERNL